MMHCSRVPGDREGGQLTETAQSASQAGMRNFGRITFTVRKSYAVTIGRDNYAVKVTNVSWKMGP